MKILKTIPSSALVGTAFLSLLALGFIINSIRDVKAEISAKSEETQSLLGEMKVNTYGKPTENPDGTLNFHGLSDRELLEFTANQAWLSNRRADATETLGSLSKMIDQMDTLERLHEVSKMIDQAEREAVQSYLPNLPENSDSFGRYLWGETQIQAPPAKP